MAKTLKGRFIPKNPQKYIGNNIDNITYRSSWEFSANTFWDTHPSILGWSSECIAIPYRNPLTGKQTVYIPDYLVVLVDKNGKKQAEMIEIKPAKEVPGYLKESTKISQKDRLSQALNMAKWQAAIAFCKKRGIKFRIITEYELYSAMKKP